MKISIDKPAFRCYNKHCANLVQKPGRCHACTEAWENTCRISQEAYKEMKTHEV